MPNSKQRCSRRLHSDPSIVFNLFTKATARTTRSVSTVLIHIFSKPWSITWEHENYHRVVLMEELQYSQKEETHNLGRVVCWKYPTWCVVFRIRRNIRCVLYEEFTGEIETDQGVRNKRTLDNSPAPLLNLSENWLLSISGNMYKFEHDAWTNLFFSHYWTCSRTGYQQHIGYMNSWKEMFESVKNVFAKNRSNKVKSARRIKNMHNYAEYEQIHRVGNPEFDHPRSHLTGPITGATLVRFINFALIRCCWNMAYNCRLL